MLITVEDLTPDEMYYYLIEISSDLPKRMRDYILTAYDKSLKLAKGKLNVEVDITQDYYIS